MQRPDSPGAADSHTQRRRFQHDVENRRTYSAEPPDRLRPSPHPARRLREAGGLRVSRGERHLREADRTRRGRPAAPHDTSGRSGVRENRVRLDPHFRRGRPRRRRTRVRAVLRAPRQVVPRPRLLRRAALLHDALPRRHREQETGGGAGGLLSSESRPALHRRYRRQLRKDQRRVGGDTGVLIRRAGREQISRLRPSGRPPGDAGRHERARRRYESDELRQPLPLQGRLVPLHRMAFSPQRQADLRRCARHHRTQAHRGRASRGDNAGGGDGAEGQGGQHRQERVFGQHEP